MCIYGQVLYGCEFRSDNTIAGVIDTTFSVECSSFGAVRSVELRPGGAAEPVSDTNKRDYVRLYVAHRFTRGAERQVTTTH